MTDPDQLLGQAEDVVRRATAQGAQAAEVFWQLGASLDLDLENDEIASAGRGEHQGGGVRVVRDGRVGFAYFSDQGNAVSAVERALDLSRLAPRKDFQMPGPDRLPDVGSRWDDELAALEVEHATLWARDLLQGSKETAPDGHVAGGGVGIGWDLVAIANSEGVSCADRRTQVEAGVNIVLADGERSLNAWDSDTVHRGRLDAHGVGVRVAEEALSLRGPREAVSGRCDLLFWPDAVAELVSGLVVSAVNGDDALRGKTVWADSLGSEVADARLGLYDDPTLPGAIGGTPFDDEGLPTRRLPIIEGGVLQTFLFDCRDAQAHGRSSTHSAVRGNSHLPPDTGTHHLVLEGRGARPDDVLVSGIDAGYLVGSVLGAHTANATTGDFSVTAPNVWRIEGGQVVGACSEVAIGGNLPALLRHLDGVGDEPKRMDGARIPSLRFRDVQVSV